MYLICGLGNPGREYETTRHNMGFLTIDVLAERLGISVRQLRFKALVGEGRVGSEKVMLMKPQTFMNLSGEAVRLAFEYYRLGPSQLLVIYDDADLAPGALRIRRSGSSGSHNGMKSVIYQLQSQDFARIRIGIGSSGPIPMERFVLGHWTEEERPLLADAVSKAADASLCFIESGLDRAMNLYNTKSEKKAKKTAEKAGEPEGGAAEEKADPGSKAEDVQSEGVKENT